MILNLVPRFPIVCRDSVIDGVNLFHEVLIDLVKHLLDHRLGLLHPQQLTDDLPAKVEVDQAGAGGLD